MFQVYIIVEFTGALQYYAYSNSSKFLSNNADVVLIHTRVNVHNFLLLYKATTSCYAVFRVAWCYDEL